jgi:hypothetical protein
MINNNSANMFNANIDIKMILINMILWFSFGVGGFGFGRVRVGLVKWV